MNVVISGATKGIGLAIAHAFAREGFNLAVCSRNREELTLFQSVFAKEYPGVQVLAHPVDVSSREDVLAFFDKVKQRWQTLDVLVNNAGSFALGDITTEQDGVLESLMAINLFGPYHLTRCFLPLMRELPTAHIINICSVAALAPYPNAGSYSISKYAMQGFSKVLRDELRDQGIKVTTVYPGATMNSLSPELPEGQIMPAEDVAAAVLGAWKMGPASVVEDVVIRPQYGHL